MSAEDDPKTLQEPEERFSGEAACRQYLEQLRWPKGFVCPRCGGTESWTAQRARHICAACRHQATVTAGTILQRHVCLSHFSPASGNRSTWVFSAGFRHSLSGIAFEVFHIAYENDRHDDRVNVIGPELEDFVGIEGIGMLREDPSDINYRYYIICDGRPTIHCEDASTRQLVKLSPASTG